MLDLWVLWFNLFWLIILLRILEIYWKLCEVLKLKHLVTWFNWLKTLNLYALYKCNTVVGDSVKVYVNMILFWFIIKVCMSRWEGFISVTLSEWNMHTTHYTKVNCLNKFCKLYTHVFMGINTWKSPFPVIVREHFLSLCFPL